MLVALSGGGRFRWDCASAATTPPFSRTGHTLVVALVPLVKCQAKAVLSPFQADLKVRDAVVVPRGWRLVRGNVPVRSRHKRSLVTVLCQQEGAEGCGTVSEPQDPGGRGGTGAHTLN